MNLRLAKAITAPALLGVALIGAALLARPTRAAQGGPPAPPSARPDLKRCSHVLIGGAAFA